MNTFLKGKKVLITGAAGSIGSALVKKTSEYGAKVIALDNNETGLFDVMNKYACTPVLADIRNSLRMEHLLYKYKPDIVFHAAAYKHVGMLERDPDEGYATNVDGTDNVLKASLDNHVTKFVFISTDKAVNPKCVMGKTKKKAEEICREHGAIIVRFGNVVSSRGSVVEIWNRRIEEGLPLTVNHKKMRRYFMGIFEAVELVLKAAEIGKPGETLVLDMGEQMNIENLAKFMIKLSKKDLGIVYTKPSKGEKFSEELMTKHERKRAKYKDGLWIIKR